MTQSPDPDKSRHAESGTDFSFLNGRGSLIYNLSMKFCRSSNNLNFFNIVESFVFIYYIPIKIFKMAFQVHRDVKSYLKRGLYGL